MWQAHTVIHWDTSLGDVPPPPLVHGSSVLPGAELHLPPQQPKGGSWVCHVPKDMGELSAFSTCLYLQKLN